jgi:putative endonuclease
MNEDKLYYVYMVADRSRVLYVGFTSDLYQWMIQHRGGRFEGFTSRYRCDRQVGLRDLESRLMRLLGRNRSKRWRREKKVFLIERDNPTWEDLSAGWDCRLRILGRRQRSKAGFSTPASPPVEMTPHDLELPVFGHIWKHWQ